MGGSQKPSVRKISEKTGFSPATVSNALNGKRGVNKETAEHILQVAEEMGYSVSHQKLKSIKFVLFRRNGQIIDDSPFHPAVIEGVEEAAKANGLDTIFVRLNYGAPDFDAQVKSIVSDPNGGVILLATEMQEEDFRLFCCCKSPLILLDGWSEHYAFNGVLINNQDSARRAVEYLIEKGHERIGYIRGFFRIKAFCSREQGYRQTLQEHNLSLNPEWTVTVGTRPETAYEDMLAWLEEGHSLPTAFFADNDLIAFSVIRAMKEKGVRIPADVSIVGFDDLPYSAVSSPALTTILVHKRAMGWEAVRRLLTMMEEPSTCKFKIESCADFVERDSVREMSG